MRARPQNEEYMKFKHTINVLIDNFKVTYKLLIYLLIVAAVSIGISAAIIVPFINSLSGVSAYNQLMTAFGDMFDEIIHGNLNNLSTSFSDIGESFSALMEYLSEHPGDLALSITGLLVVVLIRRFLVGLGNYTAGSLINDKMAMQANSPFTATLIKNLGKASLYSVTYLPISFIYDAACVVVLYFLLFVALGSLPVIINIFLFVVLMVLLMGVKMLFTTDWLPAAICGKQSVAGGLRYSFARRSGGSGSVYSFYATSAVAILAINVLGFISTFGAAIIITVPLSYLYLLCYQFANYCDNNDIKYFTDKRTIVKPEHERETSREQFLRGE